MTAPDPHGHGRADGRAADVSAYTNDQLLEGIDRALKARDMDAVAVLLRALAVQAPHEAQAVLDAINLRAALTGGQA